MKAVGIKGKYLEFKGQPLVRVDNELYYGDMSEKFYLFMMIMSYKNLDKFGTQIPDKVMVQILPTSGSGKVEKQNIVTGLSEAFDLGMAWLERANRA
jgi:hypothetical protein